MTALAQIAREPAQVKSHLITIFDDAVTELLNDEHRTPREMEQAVWQLLVLIGRELLTTLLMLACWRATARETKGTTPTLRLDDDYTIGHMTTLGVLQVPLFAYRDTNGRTRAPAREAVFPLHPHCRSSELCLEWESRLGSQLPFRQAEEAMDFFTHGAARVEDTTIARHIGVVGTLVDPEWTYRAPEDIAEILKNRATRDRHTGRPLVYISSDAHALRRYVDDTWDAEWKMLNGVRLWCVDRENDGIIHLGGEYTWGDCREVGRRVRALVERLDLAQAAQWVFIADGMPWFRDHIVPELPGDTVCILDLYHLLERFGTYAAARFGRGTKAGAAWLRRMRTSLVGKRPYSRKKGKKRRGHRKARSRRDRHRTVHLCDAAWGAGEAVLRQIMGDEAGAGANDALRDLLSYLAENTDRTDYPTYRSRGMQIGSGAMESLHRVASQMRLKLAGSRWLPERAVAVLNLRLIRLADRWDAFWGQAGRAESLRVAFMKSAVLTG